MKKITWLWVLAVLVVPVAAPDGATAAGFQGLGYLQGGQSSEAAGVSADGSVVVGSSGTSAGQQAFRWTPSGSMAGIARPAGLAMSWATDVSADGSYVSGYAGNSFSSPIGWEGWRWHTSGGLDRIAVAGAGVWAKGISDDGSVVVGSADDEAFRWTAGGGLAALGGLFNGEDRSNADDVSADGLVVVGDRIYPGAPYRDTYRWTAGGTTTVSPPADARAHTAAAASGDGSAIAGAVDNFQTALFEAIRWTAQGGSVLLGTNIPNHHSRGLGISGDGSVVVGYYQNNSGFDEQLAMIWDETHGMRLLQQVLTDDYGLDLTGWVLSRANAISDDGLTVVGIGYNPDGHEEAWRAVIPEPASLGLLGLGAIALLRRRRRRRR